MTTAEVVRNENLAISTTSIEILPSVKAIGGRSMFFLRNNSPNAIDIITICPGDRAAVANNGIILRQNDVYLESNDTGFECHQGAIQAICATINGTLAVSERR